MVKKSQAGGFAAGSEHNRKNSRYVNKLTGGRRDRQGYAGLFLLSFSAGREII
jgi:hypothetical protein